jgi:hypothetical protein
MRNSIVVICASLIGGLLVYCSQAAMNGRVPDAGAQNGSCDCGPPSFSSLVQTTLNNTDPTMLSTGSIDVSGARTLVLYTEYSHSTCHFSVSFFPTTTVGTLAVTAPIQPGSPFPALGPLAAIVLADQSQTCANAKIQLIGIR